jgi:signal transduction histidine kinase
MAGDLRKVLIIEDDRAQAVLLRESLLRASPGLFRLDVAETLKEAKDKASAETYDAILLDLSLPDCVGLETLERAEKAFERTPIIVLTGLSDEQVSVEALRRGAQDYLVKGETDGHSIARAISYAVERKQGEETLRQARVLLEQKVQERTAELRETVDTLRDEIRRRAEAENALRERSDRLRVLASELTLAEHRERQRLALVLHDGLQQLLVGANYHLGSLEKAHDKNVQETVAEVSRLISTSIDASRSLTSELSPPILLTGGLVPALQWLACWMSARRGLEVKLAAPDEVGSASEDISILLFQATRELLFNVVKHSGVKTARVVVSREEDRVLVTVIDEGSGFDPAGTQAPDPRSMGLGLFSIRERLDYLGGRMEVQSTPGQGTRVTLSAPLDPQAEAGTAPSNVQRKPAMAPAPSQEKTATGRTRVMLVDDHAVMRQGLAALLEDEPDLEIVGQASDGDAAVGLARVVHPDVVLMDINMPIMNGIEATRAIHEEMPEIKIIGLSMFEEAEQAAAMRGAGAIRYMSKSGPARLVVEAIRAVAGARGSCA